MTGLLKFDIVTAASSFTRIFVAGVAGLGAFQFASQVALLADSWILRYRDVVFEPSLWRLDAR